MLAIYVAAPKDKHRRTDLQCLANSKSDRPRSTVTRLQLRSTAESLEKRQSPNVLVGRQGLDRTHVTGLGMFQSSAAHSPPDIPLLRDEARWPAKAHECMKAESS